MCIICCKDDDIVCMGCYQNPDCRNTICLEHWLDKSVREEYAVGNEFACEECACNCVQCGKRIHSTKDEGLVSVCEDCCDNFTCSKCDEYCGEGFESDDQICEDCLPKDDNPPLPKDGGKSAEELPLPKEEDEKAQEPPRKKLKLA